MVLSTQNSNTQHVGVGMTNVKKREPTDSDGDDDSEEGYSDFLALLNEGPSTESESNKQSSSLPPVVVEVEATVVPTKESTDDDSDWLNGPTKNNEETARSTTSTEASSVTKTTPPVKTTPEAVPPVAAAPPAVESTTSITSEESTSQAPAPKKKASAPTKPAPADDASAAISVADSIAASVIGSLHIRDDAPVAVEYFTKKAAVADAMATISKRQLAVDNMSDAHRYFDKKTTEDAIKHAAEVKELIEAPRPAAVEYFTLKDMEAKAERKAANEDAVQNAQAPLAVEFFTNKARMESEAKAAEIAALKENPPPPSAAGMHFAEVERKKKLEMEAMAKEPAPAAIEYFTRKAEEEKRMQEEEARKRSSNDGSAAVASVATRHFEKQKSVRAAEIEASRARVVNDKTPDEVLPVDYFQKLGEAELAAKAKAQFDNASKEMPIGIRYFTAKGQEDKARALAKQQSLSNETMSAATRHFQKIDDEKEANSLQDRPKEAMPAAIQKFTLAEYAARDKKKAEIREMHDNPPEMAVGTAYFTKMMNDSAAEKKAEIERLKANPPPASAAGQHFAKVESQRKLEMEALKKEPAPAAIEYFTNKAREEKRAQEEAMKRTTGDNAPIVASVATQHFEKQKSMKLQQMQSKRAMVQNKPSEEALPIDYFTKLGDAETAARAQSRRDLAESHMPDAVRYFTDMAEEKKAAKLAEFEKGGGDGKNMSVATAYFNKLAAEKKAEKARKAEKVPERMPMAIQKFTLAAEEERQKKKAALEQMKVNPPPVPVGVSHFTPDADQS